MANMVKCLLYKHKAMVWMPSLMQKLVHRAYLSSSPGKVEKRRSWNLSANHPSQIY